jgi:drug/metabolite transporter (DMT)-like permease
VSSSSPAAPGCGAARTSRPQRERVLAGLRWGALTGAFIAGYTLVDGYAVKCCWSGPVLLDWFGNLLRLPFLAPAALRDRPPWPGLAHAVALCAGGGGTAGPLGYVLVLYAVRLAPLSHVAPARELSMLFAALLGGQLLGEATARCASPAPCASPPA